MANGFSDVGTETPFRSAERHPTYWFEDGTWTVRLEHYLFRLHQSRVIPHSRAFLELGPIGDKSIELIAENDPHDPTNSNLVYIKTKERVSLNDFEVLLAHIYETE